MATRQYKKALSENPLHGKTLHTATAAIAALKFVPRIHQFTFITASIGPKWMLFPLSNEMRDMKVHQSQFLNNSSGKSPVDGAVPDCIHQPLSNGRRDPQRSRRCISSRRSSNLRTQTHCSPVSRISRTRIYKSLQRLASISTPGARGSCVVLLLVTMAVYARRKQNWRTQMARADAQQTSRALVGG